MSKTPLSNQEKLAADYEYTGISITVHDPSGDVTAELIKRFADNKNFYLDKNLNVRELCTKYTINTGGDPNALGGSCAKPMNTKDCDRDALIAKLDDIYQAVDGLEVTTENIKIEAGQINLNTDEVEQLLKDIKLLLENDVTGDDCATPMHIQDCDRQALLDKLDEVATTITDNATANKDEIILELNELQTLITDIFDKLDLIEQHTKTSNDNEVLIIDELKDANTTLQSILDEKNQSLVYSDNSLICADNAGVKTTFISRTKFIWDNETGALVSETKEFSADGVTFITTAPTGTLTLGQCVAAAACKENKTYQIKGTQTITFDPNKIYGYKAGVWNLSSPITPLTGNASLTEGAGLVQKYGFGDSFGNGFSDVLMPISVVIAGLDADADVRISVIQECGYTATIV